jgi:hypothetical protein
MIRESGISSLTGPVVEATILRLRPTTERRMGDR